MTTVIDNDELVATAIATLRSVRAQRDCTVCEAQTPPFVPSRRTRRHSGIGRRVATTVVATAAVVAMAGAAAHAAPLAIPAPTPAAQDGLGTTPDPGNGGQGGIGTTPDPGNSGGGQSGVGTTPDPTPAPAPTGPSIIPRPTYDAPPVTEGTTGTNTGTGSGSGTSGSGSGTSGSGSGYSGSGYQGPSYSGVYNPVPPVLHAPRPTAPVNPILPRPGVLKFGNIHLKQPAWLSDADARNANGQAATLEARVATYYESIGFPKDQAARTAASTTLGILTGGAIGAVAVAVPAAILGGVVGAGVGPAAGAIIGALVPSPIPGALAGPGALIGLAGGVGGGIVLGGLGGATAGAIGGGVLGGIIGYAVGAGDPGGNPNAPIGPTAENPRLSTPAPPHPNNNQYEVHLDRTGLPGGGKVDYVVNKAGDVDATAKLGAVSVPLHISHQQADAPFKAAGALAQTARDTVTQAVTDIGRQAEKAIPGLKITHPQFDGPKAAGAKHRR